jgi:predicted AlkP superfamily pyrophosphatase or phosphodiesterase
MKQIRRPPSILLWGLGMLLVLVCACSPSTSQLATTTVSIPPSTSAKPAPRNIILIGWDGAQRNHVRECLGRNELPNLQQLSSEGALVAIDVTRVTDTKAGWAQILTGYEPEVTGVFSNSRYQPIPAGYTVFERLEQFFGRDNFITAAIVGKKGNIDYDPPQRVRYKEGDKAEGQIITENGVKYQLIPGKPYYNTKNGMDIFINGLVEDEKVGNQALELINQYQDKPFFFFIHFAAVDANGHKYGENSKEYNDALISADFWTGQIIKTLKDLHLYDQTLVYVTADHGFDEGMTGHSDAPYVFLATNDTGVVRSGEREDIAPTILDRFGLDLKMISPPLDGYPLTRPYKAPLW